MSNVEINKIGDLYVAEKRVMDDYNIHLECEDDATVVVLQRTAGDDFYAKCVYSNVAGIDEDFDELVYPKTIRVTSTKPVKNITITEAS